jgi:predicted NBD/HSP70 family sugar kinase
MAFPILGLVLGVDLGGSNVRVVLTDLSGRELAHSSAATEQADAEALVAQLVALARELAMLADVEWERIGAMGVGVAGVGNDSGGLRLASNLPLTAEFDLATALRDAMCVPVFLDNDVNVATLAEQRYGRGVGVSDFVFVAVGTGIGMGIVASGQLQRGATGAAGEIAFLPLGPDPFARPSQAHGSLEEVAGGRAVARRYAELVGHQSAIVSTREIFSRRASGDPHAEQVLGDQARATALAVVSAVSTLDPALVVLGGGIGSRDDFIAEVRGYVARLTLREPVLEASPLGERAGLIGAAELARAGVIDARAEDPVGLVGSDRDD